MISRHLSAFRRLLRDTRGMAAMELALAAPAVAGMAAIGIELTNQAMVNERVSQVALSAADNASRVGIAATSASQQLREVDVNDFMTAIRLQGEKIGLTTNGRVTVSSLRADSSGVQKIEWQRCIGKKSGVDWASHYGTASTTATVTGMGPTGQRVAAPANNAVIFVEVNYEYRPLVGNFGRKKRRLQYLASYIVRDNRLSGVPSNPAPQATVASCSVYEA